jgi:hypothetical protein
MSRVRELKKSSCVDYQRVTKIYALALHVRCTSKITINFGENIYVKSIRN